MACLSCRKMMGYETTGSIIKQLACNIVLQFNSGFKEIDFPELRTKLASDITETHKKFGVDSYIKKISHRIRITDLPLEKEQILDIHDKSIKETF